MKTRISFNITQALRAAPLLALALSMLTAGEALALGDHFEDATAFPYPAMVDFKPFSTDNATAQPGEPSHALRTVGEAHHSLWFNFTTVSTGFVTLEVTDADFDTVLAVYTGNSLAKLVRVAADDDSGLNNNSRVIFGARPGVVYRVAVDGFNAGQAGLANLVVTGFTPLVNQMYQDAVAFDSFEGSGMVTVTTSTTGLATGTLKMGARTFPFVTAVSPGGAIKAWIPRQVAGAGAIPLQPAILDLVQDATGLHGTLTADTEETNEEKVYDLHLLPALKYTTPAPCPRAGYYTFASPGPKYMEGTFGGITVLKTGAVVATGLRGDGAPFSLTGLFLDTGLASGGAFRGRQIIGARGHLTAVVDFSVNKNTKETHVDGKVYLARAAKPGAVFLPAGASAVVKLEGRKYVAPAANEWISLALLLTGGKAMLTADSSAGSLMNHVMTYSPMKHTFSQPAPNPAKVSLVLNKATGMVTGSVLLMAGKPPALLRGVFVRKPMEEGFYGLCTGAQFNGGMKVMAAP